MAVSLIYAIKVSDWAWFATYNIAKICSPSPFPKYLQGGSNNAPRALLPRGCETPGQPKCSRRPLWQSEHAALQAELAAHNTRDLSQVLAQLG